MKTKTRNNEWFTSAELADYLGLSRRAVFGMVARREIPFSKLGKRRLRFSKAEIDALLAGSRTAPISEGLPSH